LVAPIGQKVALLLEILVELQLAGGEELDVALYS
jgi:hypothetical protein